MSLIRDNIEEIKKKIDIAATKSGRNASDITLIAVTKTQNADTVKMAMDEGLLQLGENKVQELIEKYEVLGNLPEWHLIGHLQTNKVKYIIDKVKMIHSVESLKLAEEIDKRAMQKQIIANVLIEVNIGMEESKYGINPKDAESFICEISKYNNISVKGLMCIAPYVENGENNREFFRQMRKLFVDIKAKSIDNVYMEYLSMGMTGDYETAIEEGSNIIRIGTGIFGSRNNLYK